MKKLVSLGAAIVSVAFFSNAVHAAQADLQTIGVGAIVSESASQMDLRVLNIETEAAVAEVDFGAPMNNVPQWSTLAPHVVEIKLVNANNWELKTYTDNFVGVSDADKASEAFIDKWGYQYGGLVDEGKVGKKVGLGWSVKETFLKENDLSTGNPANGRGIVKDADGNTVIDPVTGKPKWETGGNGFTYLKDKSDKDTPEENGQEAPDGSTDQSFLGAGGYVNIAYGNYKNTNLVRPELEEPVVALEGDAAEQPFFYYLEGNFSGAPAATYKTIVNFELVNIDN